MSDYPIFNLNDDEEAIRISAIITNLSGACLLLHVILFHEHRNLSLVEQRFNWQQFMEKYGNRAALKEHLCMPLKSFDKLLSLIHPQLEVVT
jgi:hypothetical protein